jgi:O-acetyl-ADP-ribose deacetylase (regulator of RNase III)
MRFIEHPGENIWDTECEAIVVTVNCVGVMGKGIALECKQRYPEIYERYRQQCLDGQWRPGMISRMVTRDGRDIILAATKDHWRYRSRPEWVRECLQKLVWSFDPLYAYT